MKPSALLRIASIITLLYFAGHTAGMPWTPAMGPGELPIVEAMKTHPFEMGGTTRTYWDFYLGFGVCISAFLLLQAVVLWQLGSLARTDAVQVRPFVASFLVAFVVNAILAWKFFFVVPVVMSSVNAICLGLAFYFAGRGKSAQSAAQVVGNSKGAP